ncbi:MAG: 3-methyladenine DNA glycosylase 2 [Alcanivorax sp.]|nr:3-methyladenine DNA glycosylase 2 [Alcanivorax sp.]
MKTEAMRFQLPLPAGFRLEDLLDFHRRDPLQLAEQVGATGLRKSICWQGQPLVMELAFAATQVSICLHGPGKDALEPALARRWLARLIGIDQPVELFEQAFAEHPQLGPLLGRNAGLRLAQTATPFEALSWAIIGQQISVQAAVSIRRRLIAQAGVMQDGLHCYPDAGRVRQLGELGLRRVGLSATKARALLAGCDLALPNPDTRPDPSSLETLLLAVPGIGPWTTNYTLLRGYAALDSSLHGDVAVRRGIQRLSRLRDSPSIQEAQRWLATFSPWRSLVAAHLWQAASLNT